MEYVEKFNVTITEFIEEIHTLDPYEMKLIIAKKTLEENIMKDKLSVINEFIEQCLKYKIHIDKRDATFFLNSKLYGDDVLFGHLSTCWSKLCDTNKEIVFDYLILLMALAQKYKNKTTK